MFLKALIRLQERICMNNNRYFMKQHANLQAQVSPQDNYLAHW